MGKVTAGSRTLDDHLEAHRWVPAGARQWTRETENGQAVLRHVGDGGDWQQFHLRGGAVRRPNANGTFVVNDRLYGPVKFVTAPKRTPFCRADLPTEFSRIGRQSHGGLEDLTASDPLDAWASAITACATGQTQGLVSPSPPDDRLVERLKAAGWSASLDEGQLHVHVHRPGLFRQVCLEPQVPAGMKLAADLLPLDGGNRRCRKAVLRLARAANRRLPLVRFAVTDHGGPRRLRAEVHMGCAPIPSGWLPAALEVVEAAISLVARELQALRDRELAELVLAADAA
jgi:hypothetical protein